MAETSNELLDCPFCGGLAEMMNPAPQWYVRCSDCHSTAGRSPYLDAETAARNWNTRTAHEKTLAFAELPPRPTKPEKMLERSPTPVQERDHYWMMQEYWIAEARWQERRANQLNAELSAFLKTRTAVETEKEHG